MPPVPTFCPTSLLSPTPSSKRDRDRDRDIQHGSPIPNALSFSLCHNHEDRAILGLSTITTPSGRSHADPAADPHSETNVQSAGSCSTRNSTSTVRPRIHRATTLSSSCWDVPSPSAGSTSSALARRMERDRGQRVKRWFPRGGVRLSVLDCYPRMK